MLRRLRRGPAGAPPDPLDPAAFAAFGARSTILPPATVTCPHRIAVGEDVVILSRAWLSVVEEHAGRRYTPSLVIGDRARLGQDLVVACIGSVEIGPDVLTADRVFIGDTSHDYRDPRRPIVEQQMVDPRPVRIGRGAFLGINTVVLPGVTIGENAYVGAGAVVTRDVEARSVVVGNPARVVRRFDEASGTWLEPSAAAAP